MSINDRHPALNGRKKIKINVKRAVLSWFIWTAILAAPLYFWVSCRAFNTDVWGLLYRMLTGLEIWQKSWYAILIFFGLWSIITVPASYRYYKYKALKRRFSVRVLAVIEVVLFPMLLMAVICSGDSDKQDRYYDRW